MPASLILNEHSMSAVRYQRNFSSNNPTSRITSLRNAVRDPSMAWTSGPSPSWTPRRSSVEMPNGPVTPTLGSPSAAPSGPNTSPVGSTDPSITRTIRPRERLSPAFRAAPQPVPVSSARSSTPSPYAAGSVSVVSATTYWTSRPPSFARKPVSARTTSSGHPSTTQGTLTSGVGVSSSTLPTSCGAIRRGSPAASGSNAGPSGPSI